LYYPVYKVRNNRKDIKDKLKAVLKARDKTDKNKINKVDETELLKLLAKKSYKNRSFCCSYFIKAYSYHP
jgi:hypothetical protein